MQLVNRTRWPAILQTADLQTEDLAGVVIVKRTFDLAGDGRLTPSEAPMPLSPDPFETPFGVFHGDFFFRKDGADVAVLGTIRRSRPVIKARVTITIGGIVRELRVVGDRVWKKSDQGGNSLSPSAPIPFLEMPLSYRRAYGGASNYAGHLAAYPENPWGIGFYLDAEQALNHPLPNVEDAASPERYQWSDRLPVAGFAPYPMYWALRAQAAVAIAPNNKSIQSVSPSLFNNAHPNLVVTKMEPLESVTIDGLNEVPLNVVIPRERLHVEILSTGQKRDIECRIDGVYVWSDAGKVVVTNRANFDYRFQPEQLRRALLSES